MDPQLKLKALIGFLITNIEGAVEGSGDVVISTPTKRYLMTHHQDCCESVRVVKVSEDIDDKLGVVAAVDEQITSGTDGDWGDSYTKSVFTITTENGDIVIEWLGQSNGYYGEGVDFEEIKES